MNKKGFTLVEIIAVIALIGILAILITPNLIKILGDSTNRTMKVQEQELTEAGLLYLEDYCKNPLDGKRCPRTFTIDSNYKYSGEVSLNTLISNKYIDEVSLKNEVCTGCVIFTSNEAKAYLKCGESYETEGYVCN